ncbi:MGMT family protein [Luteipulveratus flavus]|uniref:MGMT family protein n=1 Tax=Luteipulveratus flavus TaxID=3031728 RepID=A0ABT6C8I0_9MICO|nr:MGMT family protein [Luteipulveratus sp. YIM 133296]MDF8265026.1 MGMT family protein [Luteipulveratus sp. YIM 133296]
MAPDDPPTVGPMAVEDLPPVADLVLAIVDQVPEGRVTTYGDVGKVAGVGPRQVGAVMSRYGSLVAWWRVLRADGRPPQGLEDEAVARYREEGTPLRSGRVDLSRARHPLLPVEDVSPA